MIVNGIPTWLSPWHGERKGRPATMLQRTVALCFGFLLLCPPTPAAAHDIAILKSSDIAAYNEAVAGFKAALPPGTKFFEYDMRGDMSRGREQAKKIRASGAALVFAVGLKAALLAKLERFDTPVVFCMVLDPAKHELKAPNMTGILLEVPVDRQLSTLRSVLPTAKRVGMLYDPEKTSLLVDEARRRAKGLGLEIVAHQVSSEKEVPTALRAILPQIDTLWFIPDSTVLTEDSLPFLLSTALEAIVPVMGFSPDLVRSGALIGLSVHYQDIGRQGSVLAGTILNDQVLLPVGLVPPDRLRLALNLKTAKYLDITLPPDIINRADELY